MGIFCQINLFKPPNTAYKPGDVVSGVIKYAVSEPMEFDKIITSLKGTGDLSIRVSSQNIHRGDDSIHSSRDTYVDVDHVVANEKTKVPIGSYEIQFSFTLPHILPSTFLYQNIVKQYKIYCRVKYYIRIKFVKPGWFVFSKHYRKEIYVISGIIPTIMMGQIIYGASKKLFRLFSRKNSIISIKATIQNSVIPIGGRIHIEYEIRNDTNVVIVCFETKLIEVFVFKVKGHVKVKSKDEVPNTGAKIGRIDRGISKPLTIELIVPADRVTIQHSKVVQRDYVVRTKATLPMPHRNIVLDIPVEIGTLNTIAPRVSATTLVVSQPTAPPEYWETMSNAPNPYVWD